jgi:hypothetical protein
VFWSYEIWICDGETCRLGCSSLKEEETTHLRSLEGH